MPIGLLALVVTGVFIVAFVVLGLSASRGVKTFSDFFITDRPIGVASVLATLASTNTALALIVFWFSYLGWQYGVGAAFWLMVCWVVGLEVFAWTAKRCADFPGTAPETRPNEPKLQTLHEYMAQPYISENARRFFAVTSISTLLLMVNVELGRGMRIFTTVVTPEKWSVEGVGFAVLLLTAVYAAWGGFNAVIRTDRVQWAVTAVSILVALGISFVGILQHPEVLAPADHKGPPTLGTFLVLPTGAFWIVGSLFSWGVWFIVTMDMWQRCSAARTIFIINGFSRACLYPWFLVITLASVLMGVYVRVHAPAPFEPFPAVRFLSLVFGYAEAHWLWGLSFVVLIVGFVSAMISTMDTYFVVIAHSVFRDLPDSKHVGDWAVRLLPRWIITIATLALATAGYPIYVLLSHSKFDINTLLYIGTSLPFVLLPGFIFARKNVLTSAGGAVGGICAGWLGLFIFLYIVVSNIHASYTAPEHLAFWFNLMYLAPMVAAVSALVGHVAIGALSRPRGTLVEAPHDG